MYGWLLVVMMTYIVMQPFETIHETMQKTHTSNAVHITEVSVKLPYIHEVYSSNVTCATTVICLCISMASQSYPCSYTVYLNMYCVFLLTIFSLIMLCRCTESSILTASIHMRAWVYI